MSTNPPISIVTPEVLERYTRVKLAIEEMGKVELLAELDKLRKTLGPPSERKKH